MITILTDPYTNEVGVSLANLLAPHTPTHHIPVQAERIQPCYACGGCKTKTFKRCIHRDDMDHILPYLAQSKTIVLVSPIVYGSFSFAIKSALDKLALIGDLHYYFNGSEIVKGLSGSGQALFAVGVSAFADAQEEAAFAALTQETLLLTGWQGEAVIYDGNPSQLAERIRA